MRNKIAFAFIAITAAFTTVGLTVVTPADAASKPDDCNRFAKADRVLCQVVKRQLPYTYATTEGGVNQVVDGKTLIHEITHQGLTQSEMRSYLRAEALNYARNAVTKGAIIVNTASMRKAFGPDAHYEVHTQGNDIAASIVE